ncbi:uncharacterized protein LOC129607905 isoform X2 [Condylostylus longicornis]|uniref:uncharacterized protein LOC129607905 isoform X2 n=1 Tax=Condylostylus longicornis TaxID=2530218 RepID=UPI00244DB56F|nr:uncharacterized protein LOC129607905 isoform X2 [Condylostylus longicornis]
MAEINTKLNQQRTIKNEKSTNFEDLIINIIKTQQCAIEYQSSVPSIWHRLLPYLKVIEEMEKQQQQQNNQEQNQYHLYKEQKLSIKSLSKSSSTTPPSSAISLENKYEGNENKNNITFENQQEVLLSSYLSSLESFQYEILLSSISISSLLIPTTTVTQTTETLIVSISSLGLSSLSSSPVSSMLSKKILKNSMTEIIIKTIKYQNNFHINDIQMTTDVVNIINFDIYINNNGIVTILLKFIFKSDDILYEKKFDVSDCKLLNFSKNHLNNSNFNNSNNNNSSYINNYNNNDDDINFCSPFKYNNNKIVKTRTIIINVSSIIKKADVNAVALIKNYNNNNNDNVTTNDKNLNSAMQITIIKSALNADKNNNINTIKSIQTITNMITDDININNNNDDYNKRNYSNYNKNEHVIFPVNFSLFNSPKYNNISSNINNLAMKNNINIKKNIINNKLKNYIITINNKNIKKGNPNKNTTILPTRLKLNSNINKYNYENINEINECININNIKNNYKLININNLKFGWCCWHNLNFIFSIFLIILIGLSSKCLAAKQDVGKECTFPPLWEGSWFLSGYQQSVHIKGSQFSYRGKCKAAEGNKYLIVDEKGCHRCLVIYEKHKNVLQYKESPSGFCRGREILQNLCDQIPGDALLFSLFREQAEPVKCPLRGPFTFTYNRGHGECRNPVSNIESCTDESRLLLNFQACPDVQGTESAAEELTCLATWKDGNSRYLVGLVSHHHAISNEERYRCFVYEKISTMMGGFNGGVSNVNSKDAEYKLAQSGDATCNGLDSAEVGSRIMTLRKPPLAERCDFPTWFKGPRHWHGLMGKSQYTYHQGDGSLIIKRINSNYETRAFCEQINKQTSTEMMAVVHHTTGCQSGFMCMMFYRRDIHIAEIQMGAPANRLEDACAPDHFDITKLPYITLLSNEPTDHTCPLEGLYKLHGAIGPPHKISRHKRNHNNKGHIQHNHHHIQLFQQQQLQQQQQQQQQKQLYEREHDFIYNHNKRNVEHEFSSASLILPSSSSLSSTSISANGIASSVASISMSSLLSSSSSLLPSTGIKRHGTFSFQNSDETTQLPTLPLEPPLVLAVGEADILSSSLSSSSSSSSASSLPYYKKHFNGNNENGIEINGNSGTIVNYRQLHTNILNNEQQEQRRLRRRRRKRETKLFNRIDLNHEQENFQILKENNNERIEILSNGIISSPSIDLTTTIISDLTNIAQIPINVNTDELSISNTNKNNYNNNNNNNDNNNNSNNDDNNDTTITNANSNNHYNKEIHFNKKLIKDFIEMKKSLKMLETSRRHEIENESLSELSISPSSTKIISSSQKLPLSSSPSSTNTNISLSNSNNKDNKDSGNNNNKKKSKNNNNNNNNSNDNELTVKINAHQSKIEILNQRSRRDTPGCIVNYKEQRYFTIGCNDDKNVIEVETKQQCDLEGDEVYYCHGHWIENGTVYVIAKNSATSHAVCITYQPQEGAGNLETKLMIVGDSCLRGQMKPPEHHLVATIKKAGKCGDPSSSTIQSINLFLFIIAFGSTILFTNR